MQNDMQEVFGNPTSIYTRRQAIEDGLLVQLSGPGYEGDPWVPVMVREAGLSVPVAITATAFNAYVWPVDDPAAVATLEAYGQDIRGRLWDVLWMMQFGHDSERRFFFVWNKGRKRRVELKCVVGPDDDGSPCLTIMLLGED